MLLCCSLLLMFCSAVTVTHAQIDWDALLSGEVLVEAVESREGLSGLRALFTVPASRSRIWAVLLDYEHFPEIFAGIDKLQVLDHDAHGATVEFWVDAVLRTYHYVLYRHYEKPEQRLTWKRLSGDLQRIEGSWEIRETPHASVHLLIYESYVKVGGVIPTSLVRWGAMRKAREMGQRLRQWIARLPADN